MAQTAIVVDDITGFASTAPAARDVLHEGEAAGTAFQIADHRPAIRGERVAQHVTRIWNCHPRRRRCKKSHHVGRVPRTVVGVQHSNSSHLPRFSFLSNSEKNRTGDDVRRNQIGASEECAEKTRDLHERLLPVLVFPQAAKNPSEPFDPHLGNLLVKRRLGRPILVRLSVL